MVLRSGIIIPFQFRDTKKLLMIGGPEENRNLSIWDLRNVVRAAFGIYNFEFRNKKIGFNIPDELLLHYLAQRHDLTNFVIEIGQVYEPQQDTYGMYSNMLQCRCSAEKSDDPPLEATNLCQQPSHSNISASNSQTSQQPPDEESMPTEMKLRIASIHGNVEASRSSSNAEFTTHLGNSTPKMDYEINEDIEDSRPDLLQERLQHEFLLQHQHQQQQHSESLLQENSTNNLRQRKERMSKRQKDLYVNFLQQNPIINEHRRNDPLLDPYWLKLADILNSVPQGAVKHVAEWKQTFDNWRYRIFLYARYNSRLTGEAALNPRNFKPLTRADKQAYAIWICNLDTAPPDLDKMRNVFMNLEDKQQD